jgi:hypothetical protein
MYRGMFRLAAATPIRSMMNEVVRARRRAVGVATVLWLISIVCSAAANAQTVADRNDPDPAEGAMYRNGALAWTPALVFSFGHDTNVYREPTGFADYETFAVPQIEGWWVHPGFFVRMIGALEVVHFANNAGAKNTQAGLSFERRQSTIRPFLSLNHRRTNANPTGFEIGYKSLRLENEIMGGAQMKASPRSIARITARLVRTGWDADARYQTSSLREKLNRYTTSLSVGYGYSLTPLTAIGGRVDVVQDRFKYSPDRDGKTLRVMGEVSFARPALIFGNASIGYEHFRSAASGAADFNGLATTTSIGYGSPDGTLIKVLLSRDTAYSFDNALAYYVMTTLNVTASRHLGRAWDVAAFGGRYGLDYRPPGLPASVGRVDTVVEYGGAAAYRVGRWARVGGTLEHAQKSGTAPYKALRLVGFLTFGSGRFQRLDRPTPFER